MDLQSFYKGKRVFLTGHTGFKGSWLSVILSLLGADVKGFSLPLNNRDYPLFRKIQKHDFLSSEFGDINNLDHLRTTILSYQPDVLIHLAAQPLVRLAYKEPILTYQTNVIGTANVLEALKKLKDKCVVVSITTDKVYENNEWIYPYREVDSLGGYDPYSSSKACAELLISSYRKSYFNNEDYAKHGISISSCRAGNVIGGGDWAKDRIIPDIIRCFEQNIPVPIRNPNAVRPWQHVIEPLFGYLQLIQKMSEYPQEYNESWNFGPDIQDCIPVKDLVKIAIETWGGGSMTSDFNVDNPHEAALLMLDINKVRRLIDWEPIYNSKQAIGKSIEWYKRILNGEDEYDVCCEQIKEYVEQMNFKI